MPDRRTHRGPHPEDERLFSEQFCPVLRQAVADLCWLLGRGYASDSSLKLVGDRFGLVARQRAAAARSACSADQARRRKTHEVECSALAGRTLWLDGYNVLTTLEAALAGGVILAARDGTYRDMASMHGTYRKVAETLPALKILGRVLQEYRAARCVWFLDRPVSNSGRLKRIMEELAAESGWPWRIELAMNPDALLCDAPEIVASADSVILDRCAAWCNLAAAAVRREAPQAWIVDLYSGPTSEHPL
ncbi:MAG: DUF434 domain-containing protein [Pirellulales bacterium]|nr:DUF434 domain-containing protein [Pirellulales bacterium]